MSTKRFAAAMAVIAAMLLTMGMGTSQGKMGSGKLFPRLTQFLQNHGPSDNMTGGGPPPPPHGSPLMHCINQLGDLSADTQSAIDALVQAAEEAKRQDGEAHKALMDAYLSALTASPLDEDALASAQAALAASMQADLQSNFSLDKSIVGLLSADELTEVAACMAASGPPPRPEE